MIRRSPCELYIKFLLCHPDGYSDQAIIDLLRLKQLDFLGVSYLQRLRQDLQPPAPFRPHDKLHQPSCRFIEEHRLFYLFHPDEAMAEAVKILDDAPAKQLVESMLITSDPESLIAFRLKTLGHRGGVKAVERYAFFFFNTVLIDTTELRALLRYRIDFRDPHGDTYDDQMREALQKVAWGDPRTMVASHPTKQIGSLLNGLRLGQFPTQLELSRVANAARLALLIQIESSSIYGGDHGAQQARDFSIAAKQLTDLLSEIGSGMDNSLYQDLQQLALKNDERPVPHIALLSGGNHTVDVMPTDIRQEVKDDKRTNR